MADERASAPIQSVPIIVSALFAPADFAWLDGLRRAHFPPERNQLPAHLTLFHHLAPSLEPELKQRLSAVTRTSRPRAMASGVISLDRGVAIRIDSPQLIPDLGDQVAMSEVHGATGRAARWNTSSSASLCFQRTFIPKRCLMPSAKRATLYRMVLPDHVCPFGVRAKQMLDDAGFEVDDCILKSRDEVGTFEEKYAVNTTPQVFIGGQHIGGSDELERYLAS